MTTPPLAQTLVRSSFATGKALPSNSVIGAAVGAGQLVASDPFTNSQILQWPNPLDPSTFRTMATPDTQPRANSACYDPANQCFYVGVFLSTPVSNKAVTVYKVTLDGTVTRLANAVDLGANYSTSVALTQLVTDGAFIYINMAGSAGQNAHAVKLSCVDGSLVGSVLTVGPTPGANATQTSKFICLANPTTLVMGGNGLSSADPWLASVPTSLGAPTIVDSNIGLAVGGQSVAAGGSVFVGSTTSGQILKISANVGTVTAITHPLATAVSAVCFDGTVLWAGGDGTVCGFDPATGAVVASRPDIVMTNTIEFLGVVNGGMVAIDASSVVGFFPNAQVQELPLLLGRGAC